MILNLATQSQELLLKAALNEFFEGLINCVLFGGEARESFRLLQKGWGNLQVRCHAKKSHQKNVWARGLKPGAQPLFSLLL